MPRLTVDLDVIRHALLGHSLSEVGDNPIDVKLRAPVTIGRLSISPEADVTTTVFNHAEDRDSTGVFSSDPRSHIAWDADSAWVKTTLTANTKSRIGFGAASGATTKVVTMSDYRIHAADDGAVRAIRRNLESFRSLNRIDDIRRLKPGEALTLDIDGTLALALRLSWPDILANRLRAVLAGAGLTGPLVLKIRRDAGADATVRLRDSFSLVVSRDRAGRFRFAVRKLASRNHDMSMAVGVAADATATPIVEEALSPLFEAITGVALRKIEAIGPRLGVDRLTTEEREIVGRLARALGLDTALERSNAVREGVDRLKESLRRELDKALRWKASIGFSYEYARAEEQSALVDYVLLDESLLASDHARASAGDFSHLAESLRADSGKRSLVRYLNESGTSRSCSSGFSLGVGKWVDVRARDERVFRQSTRTSLDGFRLVTCRGTRKYSENQIPENDFEWLVDFKAQMNEYRESPATRDFDFGIHYSVSMERGELQAADLERVVDFAGMWGIAGPDPAQLADALGRKATAVVELMFERDELARILVALDDHQWADALACSMPYMSGFPERRSFETRGRVYSKAWAEWMRGVSHPASGWATILRPGMESGLRLLEERGLPGSFAWTCGTGHAHLRDRLASFNRGLSRLLELLDAEEAPESIGEAWDLLQGFWSQRLYIAASGRYLLMAARDAGVEVHRSLRLEMDDVTLLA